MTYFVISKEERLRNLNIEMEISHYIRNDRKTFKFEITKDIKKPPEIFKRFFYNFKSKLI